MAPSDELTGLTRRLSRRVLGMQRARDILRSTALLASLACLVMAWQRLIWPELPALALLGILGVLMLAAWAWGWLRARVDVMGLLVRADLEIHGKEELTTTYDLQTYHPEHPFLPALRARCESLAQQVNPRRLAPFSLTRPDFAVGFFLVLTVSLMLVPQSWVRTTEARVFPANALVAEEGYRLEKWSERIEEIAEQGGLQNLGQLAAELKRVSQSLQSEQKTIEEASRDLEDLAELAREIARTRELENSERPQDGDEKSRPAGNVRESEDEKSAQGYERKAVDKNKGPMVESRNEQDTRPNTAPKQNMDPLETPRQPKKDDEPARTMDKKVADDVERDLVNRTHEKIQKSNYAIKRKIRSGTERSSSNRIRNAMLNEKTDVNSERALPGKAQTPSNKRSSRTQGGVEAPEGGNSESDSPASKPKESLVPKETGFVDTQVRGADPEEESGEEIWVRQLPTLNASEVESQMTIPEFQRSAVSAQGGLAVPRAYRSIVKAYFLELGRLTKAEH